MANEISVTIRSQLTNGDLKHDFKPGTIQIDQTTQGMYSAVLDIGTSEEDISFGDVATEGVLILQNLDATNFVQYGAKDTTMKTLGRLKPSGIPHIINMDSTATLRMKADTASCKVLVTLYEE